MSMQGQTSANRLKDGGFLQCPISLRCSFPLHTVAQRPALG